jgi:AcrR family transcriptional regulator
VSFPNNRGRPRDPERESALLDAVLTLVAETGYGSMSIEAVAARAGASKATIYRRWANKRQLLVAAVQAQQGPPPVPVDTGSLRGDVLELCRRLAEMLRASNGQLILALLQATAEDPALGDLLEQSAGHTGARLPGEVLQRAIDRGELNPRAAGWAYDETAGSILIMRALHGHVLDEAYLEHVVDTILLPALRHARERPGPPVPALFSGPAPAPDPC